MTTELTKAAQQACHCQTCRPITMEDMRMVLCPTCGNKRCPHANDHRNACTGSNEPGQPGSAYPASALTTSQPAQAGEVDERAAFCIYPKCLTTGRTCAGDCSKVPTQPAAQATPEPAHITVQEAWEAAGGNPGIKASKADLLEALRQLDQVCDEATPEPSLLNGLTEAVEARLKAAPTQQAAGEPVGYLYDFTIDGVMCRDWWASASDWSGIAKAGVSNIRPLFTHPAPGVPEEACRQLLEAWNFGQFADDANWPQAQPVRAAIRNLCEWLSAAQAKPRT